jgi:hypothetical protein
MRFRYSDDSFVRLDLRFIDGGARHTLELGTRFDEPQDFLRGVLNGEGSGDARIDRFCELNLLYHCSLRELGAVDGQQNVREHEVALYACEQVRRRQSLRAFIRSLTGKNSDSLCGSINDWFERGPEPEERRSHCKIG